MRFTGALFKDLTQDELQTPPLFPKLDITIKKGQPAQVRFSHTYIIAICQNQTEQLFCLIYGDRKIFSKISQRYNFRAHTSEAQDPAWLGEPTVFDARRVEAPVCRDSELAR
jgi:hypothetical protein